MGYPSFFKEIKIAHIIIIFKNITMNRKIYSQKITHDLSRVELRPKAKCAGKKCTYCSNDAVHEAVYLSAFVCVCENSECIEKGENKALLTGR